VSHYLGSKAVRPLRSPLAFLQGVYRTGSVFAEVTWQPVRERRSADGPAIIDWEAAAVGPAAGVAHTLFLLRGSDLPPAISATRRYAIGILRAAFVRTYLRAYRRRRPLDDREVRAWRLPILVARLGDGIEAERVPLRRLIEQEMRAATTASPRNRQP